MALTRFLVEVYVKDLAGARDASAQAHESMVTRRLRFHWAVYIPDDETSLLLLEAASAEDVRDALADSGLAPDRISVTR